MFLTRFQKAGVVCAILAMGALGIQGLSAESTEPPARLTFADLAACPLALPTVADERAWKDQLSPAVQQTLGHRVQITGYLLPLEEIDSATSDRFWLMRNQNTCCGRHPPPAGEHIVVKAAAPLTSAAGPVRLEGILRIAPVIVGGSLVSFFELDGARTFAP